MTKFTAIYNGKKISIEGKSLWDAKQKAIKELKVPKSKEGLVSVMSDKSIANQDFRFMEKGGRVFDTKIWDKVKNKYKSHAGGVSESEIITWAETISKKEVSNVDEAIKILRNKEVIKIGALDGGKKVTVIEVDEWSDKRISDYEKEFGHPHYGIGGVLLGSAIGGYAGYKIGRARPQKSGFDTEKKIASKLKKGASKVKQDLKEGAEKRKKKKLATSMAKGGSMASSYNNYYWGSEPLKIKYKDKIKSKIDFMDKDYILYKVFKTKGEYNNSIEYEKIKDSILVPIEYTNLDEATYGEVGKNGSKLPKYAFYKSNHTVNTPAYAEGGEIIKTKKDIKKVFGSSVTDIDETENDYDYIVQGNLDEIKSIAKKKGINIEEVEHWGIRIWKYAEGGSMASGGKVLVVNNYDHSIIDRFSSKKKARDFADIWLEEQDDLGNKDAEVRFMDYDGWLKWDKIYYPNKYDKSRSMASGGEIDDGSSSGVWFTYGKGGTINDGWGINLKWW